jgi:hypothetical protein
MTTGVLDEERERMGRRERDQGDFDANETDELI